MENKTGATLLLDANYYVDGRTHEKRLRLQGKCQLAEMPAAGVSWETDDNGFIISARGKETTATYRYDSDGYPLGKTTTAKEERFTVASTPSKDPRKKLDYTAISTFNDRTLGTVRQTCDYDDHDNPLSCELQVIDESVQPPLTRHYTIKKPYRLLLSRRLQQGRPGRFVLGQILVLEQAHADGVAVLAVNEKLMDQFTLDHKAELTVNMDRFFILFIND